ncbi:hypothetical protein BU23DRAFT_538987, partial [Bimuria novae-zelandiae CBS 107.79]
TYTSSSHCARFTYTVTHTAPLSDPACEVAECNCSICSRNGYLFIYVHQQNVAFANCSKSDLNKYTFGPKHKIAHYFCGTCGVSCFTQSEDPEWYANYLAINVRTFRDVDLKSLTLKAFDGKSV